MHFLDFLFLGRFFTETIMYHQNTVIERAYAIVNIG